VNRWQWAIVLGAATAGLMFVVSAPGNFIRSAAYLRSHDVIVTLKLIKMYAKDMVSKWVLDPKLLSVTLLFVIHPQISAFRPKWLTRQQIPWKWAILGAWLICIATSFVVPSWSLGEAMPLRSERCLYDFRAGLVRNGICLHALANCGILSSHNKVQINCVRHPVCLRVKHSPNRQYSRRSQRPAP
jgi:hypothetical protein